MKTIARLTRNKTALNFWFAIVLLLLFVLTAVTAYTDKQLHQTLGLMLAAAVPPHLWLHWSWIQAMVARLRQVKPALRMKIALDGGLLLLFALLIMSGLIVMLIWAPAVVHFHTWMFYGFGALVFAHLALNVKWLYSQLKRRLPGRAAPGSLEDTRLKENSGAFLILKSTQA